jgi:hypothetical protein
LAHVIAAIAIFEAMPSKGYCPAIILHLRNEGEQGGHGRLGLIPARKRQPGERQRLIVPGILSMPSPQKNDEFDESDSQLRFERALKGALGTPQKSLKEKAPEMRRKPNDE